MKIYSAYGVKEFIICLGYKGAIIKDFFARYRLTMLLRRRFSRIFYLRKFFDYPITLSKTTLGNLGLLRAFHIGLSYGVRRLFPIKEEKSLEDFFINRFGDTLYRLFFEDYTEKVWGVKPSCIKPDWGAQRVKGLSIAKVILHALSHLRNGGKSSRLAQKDVETSLIERFLYPKFGPGQLWERVADQVRQGGGEIRTQQRLVGLTVREGRVVAAAVQDTRTGETSTLAGDYFFSSMTKTGIEMMKWTPSLKTVTSGISRRGNWICLTSVTLARKENGDCPTELENHCQGNNPDSKTIR